MTSACPGLGLLDRKVARFGLSSGTSCFPRWLHQFPFPPIAHGVPFPPRPHPRSLSVFFLVRAVPTGVALVCTSLMVGRAELLFMCLLAICMSSLGKCLFGPSARLLIELFIHLFRC